MRCALDLDAYFARIRYTPSVATDLATARALTMAHTAAIAFENIDALMGLPVDLELAAIEDKLVHGGRGGDGFERTILLAAALRALGFTVDLLLARLQWGLPIDALAARAHPLLRLHLHDESWLIDVGSGDLTPVGLLALRLQLEQINRFDAYRVLHQGGAWQLQIKRDTQWRTLYHFSLESCAAIDYNVANYYASTAPGSPLTRELWATGVAAEHRMLLHNRQLTVRWRDGTCDQRLLPHASHITQLLRDEFGIRLPRSQRLDTRLNQLPRAMLRAVQ